MTIETQPHAISDLLPQMRRIITEELELNPDELTDTGAFVDDYDADSLSLITIVSRFEKELKVAIPRTQLPKLTTLDAVAALVQRILDGETIDA
ncbi:MULTISPECIES: acyl carrier protein [Nocardia]|uniref:acyl carrier protein n=1 Tax=Nocardia TaxID=1817 RepID=UPI003D8A60C8